MTSIKVKTPEAKKGSCLPPLRGRESCDVLPEKAKGDK